MRLGAAFVSGEGSVLEAGKSELRRDGETRVYGESGGMSVNR